MQSNISVIGDNDISVTSSASEQRIVGSIILPAQDLQQYTSHLQNRGLNIDSSYTFTDLRGGQEGAGDQQTLLVWTANAAEIGLDQVAQALQDLTGMLPYG
jgi:hypothetical protein